MDEKRERKYPLKQPHNYKAPVTRWMLSLPDEVKHVYTLYVGVQSHGENDKAALQAEQLIEDWLNEEDGRPPVIDTFRVTEGFDLVDARVWVAYWTLADGLTTKLHKLDPMSFWNDLGENKKSIGVWYEHFTTPVDRLETNYAKLDHKPGLAQIPGSSQHSHDLSAYWGAGRDRLPASAHDLFEKPDNVPLPSSPPDGIGEHLSGTNYGNMCHIRSGQWWEQCDTAEREAYENDLQKKLMTGMRYLWEHPDETGTIGLRFLQNLNENGKLIKETCGAGFHRNWADLEEWSSRHPSHLAIFNGALKHAKTFGEERKFMTWHEVSILKAGEAKFEYVNCDPKTGVIRWVPLHRENLSM